MSNENMNEELSHIVTIHWSKPFALDRITNSSKIQDKGVYFITRKYKRNGITIEKPVYVGMTRRDFEVRFNEHLRDQSNWCLTYGAKFVRFGTIERLYEYDKYDESHLLTTIESRLIEELRPEFGSEMENISQTKGYTEWYRLKIRHVGYNRFVKGDI
jgi:hypothetical protein